MFEKGNKLGQGRPKGAKNTLPLIRDKLFGILLKRIQKDSKLESVDTSTLIKFVASSLPKDMSLSVTREPEITYISNVPRPELEAKAIQAINEYVPIKEQGDNNPKPVDNTQVVDTQAVKVEDQVNTTLIIGSWA